MEGHREVIPFNICYVQTWKEVEGLKPALRLLSKEKLGKLPQKTKEAYLLLCEKQKETLLNPTLENIRKESNALKRWQKLVDFEEDFLKQKSKMHWLERVKSYNL